MIRGLAVGLAALASGLPSTVHAQHPGALDTGFGVGAGASDDVFTAAALPGGGELLGGYFTTFDGKERWRLARLRADGTPDAGFDPGDSSGSAPILQVATQPDGEAFVSGAFARFGGEARPLVARLKADGTVDTRFDDAGTFAGVVGRVNALAVLPDGKLLAGGRFDASAGSHREVSAFLVRLLPGGGRDGGFVCEPVPHGREEQLTALAVLPGGKLLVGTSAGLTRLEENGARDQSFQPAADFAEGVQALAVQPDGKIVLAAARTAGGWRVGRLEADGKVDGAFHPEEATGETAGAVAVLTLQADGKVLVGGTFREVGGVRRHGLARLNADGTLDPAFDPGTGVEVLPFDEADETPEAAVHVILPLPEGRLLVAGRFDLYNGVVCHNVVRLFDGTGATAVGAVQGK